MIWPRRMRHRLAGIVICVVAGAGLAACTTEQHPSPVAVPAGLDKFYRQQLRWESCADYLSQDDKLPEQAECTRVTVPLDYAKPEGAQAKIAISRIRASGSKIGSLVFNPGGPGVSGLWTADSAEKTTIPQRFDRIGFDPRGIGASQPAVKCLTPAEADTDRADLDVDMSPPGIASTERENQDYATKCAERTSKDVLAHLGTREVVKDIDVIRGVLGEEKLNFVGYSYGTRLGTAYAEAFPNNVRALVLDAAIDPSQDPVQEAIRQGEGFQKVFDAYARDCANPKPRSDGKPAPECPLGTDPARAVANFRALVSPLMQHPAATKDPRGLRYNDAITATQQALYQPGLWRYLTDGLNELRRGRGDTLLGLADIYEGRDKDGNYSNKEDAFNAIRCVDDPRITDRAVLGREDTEYRKAAPFLDDGRGTGNGALDVCAMWPVPNTSVPHRVSVPGLATTVVVSTTNDPATPYQAGVALAEQLGAALITFNGDQHTVVFSGNSCVDNAVTAYLVDLTAPPRALTC